MKALKEFRDWAWAVVRFVPAAILVIIMFIGFYLFCKVTGEPKEGSDARDTHHYLDHFDS
jgi:hypothetical protein